MKDKFPQIACITRPVPHQVKAMAPIAKQLREAGYRVRETFDRCPPESVVFCWGNGWAKEIRAKFPHSIICVLDHGLFHPRKKYVVTGWQGLNGWGAHPLVWDGGRRLLEKGWNSVIRPWREPPQRKTALILGQVYGDAAIVDAVEDYGAWLSRLAEDLESRGYIVQFRPHPVQARSDVNRYPRIGRQLPCNDDLFQQFEQATMVVAMNSNGLLDAFMHGVQDVRLFNKGSMLYPASIPVKGLPGERRAEPGMRDTLAARLAYCQWEPEEIDNGLWLKYHEPIMQQLVNEGHCFRWYEQEDLF